VADRAYTRRFLREGVVEKVLFRDLPGLLGRRDLAAMESLLNIFVEEPGQIARTEDLAGTLRVSRKTVAQYLLYLERSFLLRKLYNYSANRRKVERKLRRYYPAILSPELTYREDDDARSRVFEWAVVRELRGEFFWRNPYKREVDLVVPSRPPLPVEIKHGRVDTGGVEAFMLEFGVERGTIVTRDEEGSRTTDSGEISLVPAWKYLLEPRTAGE